ncbi:hypothetical protein [Streptomyces sp. NPDC000351]|uniref:hypothetical protein n=1 Tax=Streptomyces sp. NPDC000351 TaxID=3154250 RepID=UPI003328AEFB
MPAALKDARGAFVTGLHAVVMVAGLLHAALGAAALRWLSEADGRRIRLGHRLGHHRRARA